MQPGDVVADRFEIEELAGSGGAGAVYRARDRGSGELVALKIMRVDDALQAERFERETEVLATLQHPGIVRYVSHGRLPKGEPFLAMEWLEGESLGRRLSRGPLPVDECIEMTMRVAEALGVAHSRGIVHRDLKPANLFLANYSVTTPKLLDFGVAHLSGARRVITQTGVILGTPGYMAPEQARGERDIDPRADVFSLGCVLYRALTGKDAFAGDDALAAMLKVVLEEARPVRELCKGAPEALERLVARMLNKNPSERPQDAMRLRTELGELSTNQGAAGPAIEESPGLTASEWRLTCVLLVRPGHVTRASAAPPDPEDKSRALARELLANVVEPFGGGIEPLAEGSALVRLGSSGTALDQAARGAECAMALAKALPEATVVLAAGKGDPSGRLPMGEVIERAVDLLAHAAPSRVRVDEVIAGLLDVRFDVRADANGYWIERERDLVEATRTLLGKPTTCVGRDRELSMLESLFEECCNEPIARAVVITGQPGIGKSRLRYEFLRAIHGRHRPVEILIGRGDPMSVGSPFGMIAGPVRHVAAVRTGEPLEVRQNKLRARLARHLPAAELPRVLAFVGELVGVPLPDEADVQLRAARKDPRLLYDQMQRAWLDFLRAECAAQPVLLMLEDLQWGDRPSVEFIDAALSALHGEPLMIVALARPEIERIFPKLWLDRDTQPIRLGALTRKGSEKLVKEVLGDRASAENIERIVVQAAGNAFYLEELIRAVAEGKQELPGTVLAMAQARLDELDGELRRALRAASVFGRVFWKGGVRELLGGKQRTSPLEAWLDELVDRELIVVRREGKFPDEQEFGFRHGLFREAAYATLTEGDRTLGHRLAGQWLEAAGENEAIVLAEHYERGGEPERAADWYWRAAEQALAGNDFASVLERTERSVLCLRAARDRAHAKEALVETHETGDASRATQSGDGARNNETLGALRLLQAEALNWTGEHAMAERQASEALALLERGSIRWCEAIATIAVAAGKLGKIERVAEIAELVLAVPNDGCDSVLAGWRATAAVRAATTLLLGGRPDLAERMLDHVHEDELSDPLSRALFDEASGIRALFQGDPGTYLTRSASATRAFEEAGDVRSACIPLVNFGGVCNEIGAYREAETALRGALEAAERMGLQSIVTAARTNLALALARQGSLREAQAVAEEALRAAEVQDDRRVEGGVRTYLALILLISGDRDGAEREARAAVELLPGMQPLRARALATLSQILLAEEKTDEALSAAEQAMSVLEDMGGIEEGESAVRLAYAEALAFARMPSEATVAIQAARDRVLQRAAAISDPQWRASFLERAADNARTLALASAWTGMGGTPRTVR